MLKGKQFEKSFHMNIYHKFSYIISNQPSPILIQTFISVCASLYTYDDMPGTADRNIFGIEIKQKQ